jgi:hypothetical protein
MDNALAFPPSFSRQAVPRPWRPETPATPSSPILSRLSRARKATPRLAARRFRTQPPRAGGAAGAARGPRPPAQTGGGSGEVKNAVSFSYPYIPVGALPADHTENTLFITTQQEGPGLFPGAPAAPLVDIRLASGQVHEAHPLTISFPYADADHDGIVDETTIPASTLGLWFFHETTGRWERLIDTDLNASTNDVSAIVDHLPLFGLFQSTPAATPLTVELAADSPSGTVTAPLAVVNQEVARVVLTTENEGVQINRLRVMLSDQAGDPEVVHRVIVRLVDPETHTELATQTLTTPVGDATLIPTTPLLGQPHSSRTLGVQVSLDAVVSGAIGAGASRLPQAPATPFAWLSLAPLALGCAFFPRSRRRASRHWMALVLIALWCSVVFTACTSDDDHRTFTFTMTIPAGAVTGEAALSGAVAAPAQALPGLTITVQE